MFKKFKDSELFIGRVQAHPKVEFFVNSGSSNSVYYDRTINYNGSAVPDGYIGLNTTINNEVQIDISAPPGSPAHWYSADALVGFTNGQNVDAFPDGGTRAQDLAQTTDADRPSYVDNESLLNGKPFLSFDGTEFMVTGLGTEETQAGVIACVVRPDTVLARAIMDGVSGGGRWVLYALNISGGKWTVYAGANATNTGEAGLTPVANEWVMLVGTIDHPNVATIRVNGTEYSATTTPSTQTIRGVTLGAYSDTTNGWIGDIAELVIYSSDDTSYGTLASIENYFVSKYGSFPQS